MLKNIKPKLCEQGKIKIGRLGEERQTRDGKNTYRLPTKLDHFLIVSTERDKSGNFTPNIPLMEEIAEMVGEKSDHLTTIPVVLLYDEIDQNFYTSYNAYQGKTRICTGDGQTATILATGEQVQCPCPKLDQGYKGSAPCKIYGRLQVVMQNMDIVGGCWTLRTTSWNSVMDILGSLILIKRIAGRLSGIPLMLKLTPKTTQIPTGQVTIYTTSLIYQGSPLALAETAKKCLMLEHDETLSPDQTITQEEETEIAEEFYPPETDIERAEATAEATTEKVHTKKSEKKKEEPTAAKLARADANKLKKKEAQAKAAAKEQAKTKREKTEATAAAKEKLEEAKPAEEISQEEPPVDEGEVLDGEASDFGWI
jgi:hypothetical protein